MNTRINPNDVEIDFITGDFGGAYVNGERVCDVTKQFSTELWSAISLGGYEPSTAPSLAYGKTPKEAAAAYVNKLSGAS